MAMHRDGGDRAPAPLAVGAIKCSACNGMQMQRARVPRDRTVPDVHGGSAIQLRFVRSIP